jgi:histone acetyltransferase 1
LQDKQYEIWSTSVADPAGLEIWRNMQVLVLLFVDGASPIELSEDWTYERWTLHLLYEVTPLEDTAVSPYTIAGFSTSHRYWIFPTLEVLRATNSLPSPPSSPNGDVKPQFPPRLELADNQESQFFKEHVDPLQLPSRERISQFLILPPYQGQSLGTRLYETIFNRYLKEQNVYEIAVEDPNVAFDAMRDYSDLVYLRKLPEFTNLTLAASLPPELLRKSAPIPRDQILGNGTDLTALRHKVKIVPRQFERMVELHLLSTLPPAHRNRARLTRKEKASNEDDRKYYFWRLAVKARIYRQNADTLDEMKDDPEQRVKILEDAVDRQLGEYEERLAEFERRQQWADGEEQDAGEGTARQGKRRPAGRGMKRSRVVEEEDEDDDWEDIESVASSKRTRV